MVVQVHELSGFQRDLLYVIAGFDHPSGRTVADELERTLECEITHGRLYPNLDALVEAELVEKGEINRRTNFYTLTPDGEEALRRRRRWEDELYDPT
ncbi:PadR family transcriptional regulator [Halorubrum sp. SD683]|uniref:PadR family transcriptional regulator n=1 Tax=Halorubrum sp. SD683 TaxID=1855873 RepID=UPI000A2D4B59|nr:PadR family transcriptional regulator [Halorubrum sp. SD683]OTF01980.1 PadR family transcriptional regulator [Halorubrum sp. SD683]